jgi:hypothetical protein
MLSQCAVARNCAAGPTRFIPGPCCPGFVEAPSDLCIWLIFSLGSISHAISPASTCVSLGFLPIASRRTALRSRCATDGSSVAPSFSGKARSTPSRRTRSLQNTRSSRVAYAAVLNSLRQPQARPDLFQRIEVRTIPEGLCRAELRSLHLSL